MSFIFPFSVIYIQDMYLEKYEVFFFKICKSNFGIGKNIDKINLICTIGNARKIEPQSQLLYEQVHIYYLLILYSFVLFLSSYLCC